MIYLKIIFIKVSLSFNLLFWNTIKFFRGNKNIDLKNIKKIILNRKDRIWDAVITKPFITIFSKYIKKELRLDIEIEVECSKYNEFIFTNWNIENFFKISSEETELINYWRSILTLLKYYLSISYIKNYFLYKKLHWKHKEKEILYIDLVWDYKNIINKMEFYNSFFIWPNLWLNNYLLDYSINDSYVWLNNQNLIESYIKLISQSLGLKNFKSYVYDNISVFYEDYNNSYKKDILLFIGNKDFRNLSKTIRRKLITSLSLNLSNKKIYVIDDNNNHLYKILKTYKYPKNVKFIKNRFSLPELKNFSKNFQIILWIDWWGFNYIRTCTNSLEIFTLGNPKVWSLFTWNNYETTKIWKYKYSQCNIDWKIFSYISKSNLFLPSYDYPLPKKIFNDFPINVIISKVKEML